MPMMNPLASICLFVLTILCGSHAQQDINDLSIMQPSSVPTSVTTIIGSISPSDQQSESPSIAPSISSEPTRKASLSPSSAPVLTSSPTEYECANDPHWYYEFYVYSNCYWNLHKLTCDDDRVECWDYGSFGSASLNCCKCKYQCLGQCNAPISTVPTLPGNDDYNNANCYDGTSNTYNDDYNGEDDQLIGILTIIGLFVFCCISCALQRWNNDWQRNARREAARQTMAARRQQRRRQSNSHQGLTEEERNHARYEIFRSKFHFQTVLQDKSNISARSLRSSTTKPDEEHPNNEDKSNDGGDASSVVGTLSNHLSSWRRPSAKDECCICLECYNVGENICAPITTECNHVFHEGCILQWVKNNDKCPLCRVDLLKD